MSANSTDVHARVGLTPNSHLNGTEEVNELSNFPYLLKFISHCNTVQEGVFYLRSSKRHNEMHTLPHVKSQVSLICRNRLF